MFECHITEEQADDELGLQSGATIAVAIT